MASRCLRCPHVPVRCCLAISTALAAGMITPLDCVLIVSLTRVGWHGQAHLPSSRTLRKSMVDSGVLHGGKLVAAIQTASGSQEQTRVVKHESCPSGKAATLRLR